MFKAIQLSQGDDKKTIARIETLDETALPPGDVTVRVEYSSLNFKDALAITGRGAIVKSWPLVPGIDLAGVVEESASAEWRPGDRVVVNGWGMGESHGGGLAQKARLPAAWLLRLPASLSTRQAMAVGTAGYTAALCTMALQRHGIAADAGPILVTGASGGVGSVATALLAGLGYAVTASTGRPQEKQLPRGAGRGRGDRSRRARGAGQALAARTLGRRRRLGRQPYAGQHLRRDPLQRRGRRLRTGAGQPTFPPPSCRSSCAASRSTASTASTSTTRPGPAPGS